MTKNKFLKIPLVGVIYMYLFGHMISVVDYLGIYAQLV